MMQNGASLTFLGSQSGIDILENAIRKEFFNFLRLLLRQHIVYEENTLVIQPRNFHFLKGRIAGKGVHS